MLSLSNKHEEIDGSACHLINYYAYIQIVKDSLHNK